MPKPKDEIVKTTIRVPKPLWDKVRIRGIEQSVSAESLVVLALERMLKGGK